MRDANDLRLTLVIASLAAGGAERVMAAMANYWAERGRHVTLITLASELADYQQLRDGRIRRVALDVMWSSKNPLKALRNNCRRVGRLADAISGSGPHAVISFLSDVNVLTLAATRRRYVPVIVAERTNPMAHHIGLFWDFTRRVLYRRAAAVVVQSPEVHEWATAFVAPERVYTIPNAVMSLPPVTASEAPPCAPHASDSIEGGRTVLAMGRLAPEKGFDLLVRAFATSHSRDSRWSLVILGEGPERPRLEALIRDLDVETAVRLPGYAANPEPLLRRADLFVLPSRYEGFPNALLEAMAHGKPVIATDCPSGPRHIVCDGVNGLLVKPDNVCELSDALLHLMENPAERQRLGRRAIEVANRFSLDTMMKCWDEVIVRAVSSAA